MKKIFILLLACMLCVTGCGKKEDNNNTQDDNTNKVSNTTNQTNEKVPDEEDNGDIAVAKELVCTMSLGEGMTQYINIKFSESESAISMDTTVIVDLTDIIGGETLTDEMRESLLGVYEEMFSEKNGYKNARISIEGNTVTVKVDLMDASQLKALYGYKLAKHSFELSGYTCE